MTTKESKELAPVASDFLLYAAPKRGEGAGPLQGRNGLADAEGVG